MNHTPRGNGVAATPEEELLLIHVALAVITVVLGSVGILWLKGATWLVEHQVLAAAAAHPVLSLPGADGAGLDLPRAAIAAGFILAGIACALSAASRAVARRYEVRS